VVPPIAPGGSAHASSHMHGWRGPNSARWSTAASFANRFGFGGVSPLAPTFYAPVWQTLASILPCSVPTRRCRARSARVNAGMGPPRAPNASTPIVVIDGPWPRRAYRARYLVTGERCAPTAGDAVGRWATRRLTRNSVLLYPCRPREGPAMVLQHAIWRAPTKRGGHVWQAKKNPCFTQIPPDVHPQTRPQNQSSCVEWERVAPANDGRIWVPEKGLTTRAPSPRFLDEESAIY